MMPKLKNIILKSHSPEILGKILVNLFEGQLEKETSDGVAVKTGLGVDFLIVSTKESQVVGPLLEFYLSPGEIKDFHQKTEFQLYRLNQMNNHHSFSLGNVEQKNNQLSFHMTDFDGRDWKFTSTFCESP